MSFRTYILKWLGADIAKIVSLEARVSNLEDAQRYTIRVINDLDKREKTLMDAATAQADLINNLNDHFTAQADQIAAMETAIVDLQNLVVPAAGVDPAVVEAQAQAVLTATSAMKAETKKMLDALAALTPPAPSPSPGATGATGPAA